MGKRGPQPEPTALRLIKGNPGRRPLNNLEPQPRKQAPPRPAWLDADAAAVWDDLADELNITGLLTSVDGHAFAAYCATYARWRRAQIDIDRNGETETVRGKGIRRRAIVAICRELLNQVLKFQREFGLSPSSRSSIEIRDGLATQAVSGGGGRMFNHG